MDIPMFYYKAILFIKLQKYLSTIKPFNLSNDEIRRKQLSGDSHKVYEIIYFGKSYNVIVKCYTLNLVF